MKWTIKDLQLFNVQHRVIDGVLQHRSITIYGNAEVILDEDGITEMAHRALRNGTGRSRDGHLSAKVITRHTETSEWEAQ